MSRVVRISDEVFKALQDKAREQGLAFASLDNVLRFMFNMPQAGRKRARARRRSDDIRNRNM